MKREKGVTLIELIVVLGIVACLAMFVLPSFGSVFKENRLSDAKSTLLGMQLKLDKFLSFKGEYPQNVQELKGVDTENSHYDFLIERGRSCASKWCYVLVAQPKKLSRKDEILKLYSSGEREGNW